MSPPNRIRRLVITDVDNTLFDFGSYFEAGLRGFVDAATDALGMTQNETLEGLKAIFSRHGSIEYPFAVEEFAEVSALPSERRGDAINICLSAFWNSAKAALRPYPGVIFALRHLKRDGIGVVAFTDAPIHEASRRLRALSVDRDLAGVVATQWFGRRSSRTFVVPLGGIPGFVRIPRRFTIVGRLANDERKPNPQVYADIMNAFNLTPDRVTVIGDSPDRDLAPAAALGMQAIWARYGRRDPSKETLLQQVVPYKLPEVKVHQDDAASPFPAVDRFDELLNLLPTRQLALSLPI